MNVFVGKQTVIWDNSCNWNNLQLSICCWLLNWRALQPISSKHVISNKELLLWVNVGVGVDLDLLLCFHVWWWFWWVFFPYTIVVFLDLLLHLWFCHHSFGFPCIPFCCLIFGLFWESMGVSLASYWRLMFRMCSTALKSSVAVASGTVKKPTWTRMSWWKIIYL